MKIFNNSLGKPYFTQRNNKIKPFESCTATSIIMALYYSNIPFPMSDNQPEDDLMTFINTNPDVIHYYKNNPEPWIRSLYEKNYPANEIHFFEIMEQQALKFGINYKKPPKPDRFFDETTELYIGKTKIKFISTPGHSPDEYCIYLPDEDLCFTGDVLFNESIGRTDLWGGDYYTLLNSIKTKLYSLPSKTIILPGHGEKSKIEHEMMYNPFIKVVD